RAEDGEGPDTDPGGAAGEPPLPQGGGGERSGLRPRSGGERRRVGDGRVRDRAPRACVEGGDGGVREGAGRRIPDGEGAGVPGPIAEVAGDALRRGAGWGEGLGQDQGDREPASPRELAARRRGDGLHLPEGAGHRGGEEPRRGGQAGRGAAGTGGGGAGGGGRGGYARSHRAARSARGRARPREEGRGPAPRRQ